MNIGADLEKEKPDASNLPQVGEDETTELQQLMEKHALSGQETKKQLAEKKQKYNGETDSLKGLLRTILE